jgi:hypothetical protein
VIFGSSFRTQKLFGRCSYFLAGARASFTAKRAANAFPPQALVSKKYRPNPGRPGRTPGATGPEIASPRFHPDSNAIFPRAWRGMGTFCLPLIIWIPRCLNSERLTVPKRSNRFQKLIHIIQSLLADNAVDHLVSHPLTSPRQKCSQIGVNPQDADLGPSRRERVWPDRDLAVILTEQGLVGAALLPTFLAVEKSRSRAVEKGATETEQPLRVKQP